VVDNTAFEMNFPELISGDIDFIIRSFSKSMQDDNLDEARINTVLDKLIDYAHEYSSMQRVGYSPAIDWKIDEFCFRCGLAGLYHAGDTDNINLCHCRECKQILVEFDQRRYILDFKKKKVLCKLKTSINDNIASLPTIGRCKC
jgi:hypothetical protein